MFFLIYLLSGAWLITMRIHVGLNSVGIYKTDLSVYTDAQSYKPSLHAYTSSHLSIFNSHLFIYSFSFLYTLCKSSIFILILAILHPNPQSSLSSGPSVCKLNASCPSVCKLNTSCPSVCKLNTSF